MDFLKGEGRSILFIERDDGRMDLVSYPDESWGIVRNGRTLCVCECDELTDCLGMFVRFAARPHAAAGQRACGGAVRTRGWDFTAMN